MTLLQKILIGCLARCLLLTLLVASCAPQPDSVAEPTSISNPTTSPLHTPEIRFALVGESERTNVWQLFDQSGATYANQALHSGTFPSLYQLAPQDASLQSLAAEGFPSRDDRVVPNNNGTPSWGYTRHSQWVIGPMRVLLRRGRDPGERLSSLAVPQ